ncbi:MAG: hypothetical protein JOZ29_05965 [Deltaproteobacteria bacterium]|nr:hypothetical protein [Deltaproteobacteria bacterium]
MLEVLKDVWGFARARKKFWMIPLIGTLLMLGGLMALAQFSTVAPFIYTLF